MYYVTYSSLHSCFNVLLLVWKGNLDYDEIKALMGYGSPKLPDSERWPGSATFGLRIFTRPCPILNAKEFILSKAGKGRKNTYLICKLSLCGGYGIDIGNLIKRDSSRDSEAVKI
jgi:hypothetical protein